MTKTKITHPLLTDLAQQGFSHTDLCVHQYEEGTFVGVTLETPGGSVQSYGLGDSMETAVINSMALSIAKLEQIIEDLFETQGIASNFYSKIIDPSDRAKKAMEDLGFIVE